MQIINLLNKNEAKQFMAGQMIQTVGTNPLIAFEGNGRRARSAPSPTLGVIDVTPRGNSPKLGHFQCPKCPKVCTTRQALGGHVASHNRKRKLLTHVGHKHS